MRCGTQCWAPQRCWAAARRLPCQMAETEAALRVGELAQRIGVSPETLRALGIEPVLDDLSRANVHRLALAWASDAGASVDDVVRGSCFRIVVVHDVPEHRMRLASALCGAE